MEKSTNYNFNLPNSANDEIADINDISDNFRIIDEIMKETEQTYSPTSANAQSGKAVAEAVTAEQNRADNTFSNALKGSKRGSAILIDDVSPVSHNMGVKISSNTVTDLTAVKVSRYGKNLFNKTSVLDTNNWVNYQAGYRNYRITGLTPNTVYTFSMSANNWVGVSNNSFYMSINTVQSVYSPYPIVHNNGLASYNPKTQTITSSNNGDLYLQFYDVTAERLATCFNGLIDLQLEIGSARTNYEPYKIPTDYTPTADGTINGVTSLYPSTTLTTDTEGVLIDCEYNRDINKAFAALEAAIATNNS